MGKVGGGTGHPDVVAIVGPTAAGKTALGVELALRMSGEVVSADARQVYRYMDIGTAKPSAEDRNRVPHHFIDTLDPREDYNAARYGAEARGVIREIQSRGKLPVVVGGSGLYLRAALDGLFEGPGADPAIRHHWEGLWRDRGEEALREALRKVDPETEGKTEKGKPRRLIRALEVFELTGVALSEHHRLHAGELVFHVHWVGVAPDREALYRRIDIRAVAMIDAGLIEEAKGLLERGYDRNLNSLNTVGYREAFDHLEGALDISTMLGAIQMRTRQYAKRQLTWFRADGRIRWIERAGERLATEIAEEVSAHLGSISH